MRPFPADTIFLEKMKKFDIIIRMYDQVLTPIKHYLNMMQLILLLVFPF